MKVLLSLWMALMLGVCLSVPLSAQDVSGPDEDVDMEEVDEGDVPPPPQFPMRPARNQMRDQYQRQQQRQGGQGMDQGRGGREGNWRVEPEELLAFLQQHEPKMAEKLMDLRQEDPQAFLRQVNSVGRLYQPVMRQMQYDPTMGEISLKRIRTQVQAEDVLQEYAKATTDADKTALRKKLEGILTTQFDVVIEQQELFIQRGQQRAEELQKGEAEGGEDEAAAATEDTRKRRQERRDRRRSEEGGRRTMDRGPGGMGMGAGGRGMGAGGRGWSRNPENMQARVEEQKKAIAYWKTNREVIVKERLGALLDDKRPFPW